jgi:hypothetical protein
MNNWRKNIHSRNLYLRVSLRLKKLGNRKYKEIFFPPSKSIGLDQYGLDQYFQLNEYKDPWIKTEGCLSYHN